MQESGLPWEIAIPLKRFLTITMCPPRWRHYDLYLFSDDETGAAFYAGQSECAFGRVWEHIRGGPHGHSIIGRFVLCNWPRSARFTLSLLDSRAPRFAPLANSLDAAERSLIEQYRPCFNVSLNAEPSPLPEGFLPPNATIKYLKNFSRMIREAGYVKRGGDEDAQWE